MNKVWIKYIQKVLLLLQQLFCGFFMAAALDLDIISRKLYRRLVGQRGHHVTVPWDDMWAIGFHDAQGALRFSARQSKLTYSFRRLPNSISPGLAECGSLSNLESGVSL